VSGTYARVMADMADNQPDFTFELTTPVLVFIVSMTAICFAIWVMAY
jgi:hypothetical protein